MAGRKKYPPFGRVAQGRHDIKIYTGCDDWCFDQCSYWNKGTQHIGAVLLPDRNPGAYNWQCCRNAHVMVIGVRRCSTDVLTELGHHLVAAGAFSVGILYRLGDDIKFVEFLQRGERHAA